MNDGDLCAIQDAVRRLGSRLRGNNVALDAHEQEPGAMANELSWCGVRRRLQALVQEVAEEIHTYPAPITACDAQFNRLLELRRLLPVELARLEVAAGDPAATVEAFIRASPCRAEL
jgi:hypothetical protein